MEDLGKQFWLSEQASKVFEIANAEQKTLQPIIANIIEQSNPKTILDYGCGDSFVSRLINKTIEIGLYDINMREAIKASEHLKDRKCTVYGETEEIPKNYFEFIIFSFVLICLSNKDEFRKILKIFTHAKTPEGKVLIVTTHPCFRQYDFRPVYTEYSKGAPFNYFDELKPFEVFIRDDDRPAVSFTDFHWTLEDTINELISAGLVIERIQEIKDSTFDNIPANKFFSPFIIITCK